jgi:hypothetical protein
MCADTRSKEEQPPQHRRLGKTRDVDCVATKGTGLGQGLKKNKRQHDITLELFPNADQIRNAHGV